MDFNLTIWYSKQLDILEKHILNLNDKIDNLCKTRQIDTPISSQTNTLRELKLFGDNQSIYGKPDLSEIDNNIRKKLEELEKRNNVIMKFYNTNM